MDDVTCAGSETSLGRCLFSGWGINTVGTVKMQEWCAKVGRFIAIAHIVFVCLVSVREGRWA